MTPIGEVVEFGSRLFVAGAYRLHEAPPFGALVRVGAQDSRATYGVVYDVRTGGEWGGRAVVRGRDGMYDAAIYDDNPDLAAVLQTEFRALIVGFSEGGTIRHFLPPLPPPVHYSVHVCAAQELRAFSERLDWLPAVLDAGDVPADELAAALLREAAATQDDRYAYLVAAGRRLALLLRDEHARMMAILGRIR